LVAYFFDIGFIWSVYRYFIHENLSLSPSCPPSLTAVSAGLLHVQVPVLGNPAPGLKLLQPFTPFEFPHSECPFEHRHREAVQVVEHLLMAPLHFSDVVLLTIPLLLLSLKVGNL